MRHLSLLAVLLTLLPAQADEPLKPIKPSTDTDTDGWVALFDGKSLDGWIPKIKGYELGDNYADTFRVEDGVIKVGYDKYEKWDKNYGHLFYKDKFSHYRMRVEYRFVGEQVKGGEGWALRNSGLMVHCQDPKTMGKDQNFPVSIEVQFLGGNGKDKRPTCNLCTPGTNVFYKGKLHTPHCTNSTSKTIHGDEWVTAEIEVNGGGVVKHFVNGELVLEYEKPQYDPKDADAKKLIKDEKNLILEEGWISLQSESHPCEFRKVEVKVLKK